MEYLIEKDIPLPASRSTYPFEDLAKGQSFFVAGEENIRKTRGATSTANRRLAAKYTCRLARNKKGDVIGARVWRTD